MKIACFLIKHFWKLQEIENTIIACFCPSSYCLRMRNWRSLFLAILRKVWLEDRQFSVLSTITFMSNWRNPVMKKHHPKASIKNRKSKPYTCKLCNKTSVPKTTQNGMFEMFLTKMANFVANLWQDPYWRKTHTRASYATKTSVTETSQKWHVLNVFNENG